MTNAYETTSAFLDRVQSAGLFTDTELLDRYIRDGLMQPAVVLMWPESFRRAERADLLRDSRPESVVEPSRALRELHRALMNTWRTTPESLSLEYLLDDSVPTALGECSPAEVLVRPSKCVPEETEDGLVVAERFWHGWQVFQVALIEHECFDVRYAPERRLADAGSRGSLEAPINAPSAWHFRPDRHPPDQDPLLLAKLGPMVTAWSLGDFRLQQWLDANHPLTNVGGYRMPNDEWWDHVRRWKRAMAHSLLARAKMSSEAILAEITRLAEHTSHLCRSESLFPKVGAELRGYLKSTIEILRASTGATWAELRESVRTRWSRAYRPLDDLFPTWAIRIDAFFQPRLATILLPTMGPMAAQELLDYVKRAGVEDSLIPFMEMHDEWFDPRSPDIARRLSRALARCGGEVELFARSLRSPTAIESGATFRHHLDELLAKSPRVKTARDWWISNHAANKAKTPTEFHDKLAGLIALVERRGLNDPEFDYVRSILAAQLVRNATLHFDLVDDPRLLDHVIHARRFLLQAMVALLRISSASVPP